MVKKEHLRQLRREMTDAERLLWRNLRAHRLLGEKFRRQHPLGRYVVDFVHLGARLIIEADGGQHNGDPQDVERDAWLREQGYRVLRFWNSEIFENTVGVLERILIEIGTIPLSPNPSPARGEGNANGKAGAR